MEIPAACASEGASEFLGVEQRPRQVMSSNSSPNLPHNALGVAGPHVINEEGGTVATETVGIH